MYGPKSPDDGPLTNPKFYRKSFSTIIALRSKYWSGGGYAHANTFYAHLSTANAYGHKARKLVKKGTRFRGRGVVKTWWWHRGGVAWRGGRAKTAST